MGPGMSCLRSLALASSLGSFPCIRRSPDGSQRSCCTTSHLDVHKHRPSGTQAPAPASTPLPSLSACKTPLHPNLGTGLPPLRGLPTAPSCPLSCPFPSHTLPLQLLGCSGVISGSVTLEDWKLHQIRLYHIHLAVA